MTTPNYARAIDRVLKPAGFIRVKGPSWRREVDGYVDVVNLDSSPYLPQRAVRLRVEDVATKSLLRQITAGVPGGLEHSAEWRLGYTLLPSGEIKNDHWWDRDDADAPLQVAELLQAEGLKRMEALHSIEAMTRLKRSAGRVWMLTEFRLELALLLWRQGEQVAACELLQNPPSRAPENWKAKVEAVRQFVCETPPPDPPET